MGSVLSLHQTQELIIIFGPDTDVSWYSNKKED